MLRVPLCCEFCNFQHYFKIKLKGCLLHMDIAYSVKNVPIRLTYERWYHIIENHDDLASYFYDILEIIEKPEFIIQGNKGTLKATKNIAKKKWMVVIYRELSKNDGFIITAYFLSKKPKGKIIWKR